MQLRCLLCSHHLCCCVFLTTMWHCHACCCCYDCSHFVRVALRCACLCGHGRCDASSQAAFLLSWRKKPNASLQRSLIMFFSSPAFLLFTREDSKKAHVMESSLAWKTWMSDKDQINSWTPFRVKKCPAVRRVLSLSRRGFSSLEMNKTRKYNCDDNTHIDTHAVSKTFDDDDSLCQNIPFLPASISQTCPPWLCCV